MSGLWANFPRVPRGRVLISGFRFETRRSEARRGEERRGEERRVPRLAVALEFTRIAETLHGQISVSRTRLIETFSKREVGNWFESNLDRPLTSREYIRDFAAISKSYLRFGWRFATSREGEGGGEYYYRRVREKLCVEFSNSNYVWFFLFSNLKERCIGIGGMVILMLTRKYLIIKSLYHHEFLLFLFEGGEHRLPPKSVAQETFVYNLELYYYVIIDDLFYLPFHLTPKSFSLLRSKFT